MNNEAIRTSGQSELTSWGGLQSHMQIASCHQQEHKICEQKSIILDNGSTMSIFHDRELVYDIVKADNPIKIVTNAGTIIVSKQAMVAGFGKVWFDEQAIANIFALADLKKKYHVIYDPTIEDAYNNYLNHKIVGIGINAEKNSDLDTFTLENIEFLIKKKKLQNKLIKPVYELN